jgi:hypothetical protein
MSMPEFDQLMAEGLNLDVEAYWSAPLVIVASPELLGFHAGTPANGSANFPGDLRHCPLIDRELDVGDISGIQDRIQLSGSRQMPRKASRISGMSLPKPSL